MHLKKGCMVCSGTTNLQRCEYCKVVHYCRSHRQARYRSPHSISCTLIEDARLRLASEEESLRYDSAHSIGGLYSVPLNVFESCVGFFWDILATRDYLLARHAFTDALLRIDTEDAVLLVVSEYADMLRLCRRDDLEIRHRMPAQLLRLGEDQQCYDFLKFWANEEDNYVDSEDPVALRRRYDDSDILEDPTAALRLSESVFEMGRLVPAFLLKLSLWLKMREIAQTLITLREMRKNISLELIITIQLHLATPAVLNNAAIISDIRNGRNLEHHIATLRHHAGLICRAISHASGGFWDVFHITDEEDDLESSLLRHLKGPPSEPAVIALQRNYQAFVDIPHAVPMTESIMLEEEEAGEWEVDDEEQTDDIFVNDSPE